MASCAACTLPIVHGQRFLLEGTEVFHAQCIQAAYRSKLRLSEARVRELERQLEDTRRAAAHVDVEANRLRNDAASARARAIALEAAVSSERNLRAQAVEMGAARGDELVAAMREISALRAELAATRVVDAEPEQELDATVARFKMLELD